MGARTAGHDVNRSFRITTMGAAVGLILALVWAWWQDSLEQQPLVKGGRSGEAQFLPASRGFSPLPNDLLHA
jgi:hypothetical protein